jgi:hypothetical protein
VIDYQQAVHDVHGIEASPLGVDPSKTLATLLWGFTPAVGVPVARGGLAEKVESRRSPEPLMAVMSNKIPEQIESLIKSRRSCEPLMNVMANKVPVKDIDGNVVGEKEVRLKVAKHAEYCVHRKVVAELANRRQGTASAKTRAEVRGGGRKPYAQKGSGNARRGSSRSPLIVGGGRSFGPRPRSYKQKINKKEGQVAISRHSWAQQSAFKLSRILTARTSLLRKQRTSFLFSAGLTLLIRLAEKVTYSSWMEAAMRMLYCQQETFRM